MSIWSCVSASEHLALTGDQKGNVAAFGGVLGAVLASSCCIAPLVLVTLGASGAWIGNLTALKAYQPFFVTATLAFLSLGFWQVYAKPKPACDDGTCEMPLSATLVKVVLWVATGLVVLAITVDVWAPLFY